MTEKLFERDARLLDFTARVLDCRQRGAAYAVTLDRTAFFPEGGGQGADHGTLGGVCVTHAASRGDAIEHLCAAPLPVGRRVSGRVDAARRLDQTQQHSGEHIFSGLMHRTFGVDNVGFHIGAQEVTLDFNGEFTWAQLLAVEERANALVHANVPVRAWYPPREALAALDYRSKKALAGAVRIVDIPGGDTCACCGTHVRRTGEIGIIKLLSAMRYKGGMRLSILCGARALRDYEGRRAAVQETGALLSSRAEETPDAVRRLLCERDALRRAGDALCECIIALHAASLAPGEDALLLEPFTPAQARRCALALAGRARVAACFAPCEGGFAFAVASAEKDVRPVCAALCAAFSGRGGGKRELAQGTLPTFDLQRARAVLARERKETP